MAHLPSPTAGSSAPDVYEEPSGNISFGDIFAAEWFYDAYLRRDAVPLVEFSAKGGRGWRATRPSDRRDTLFAHGQQRQAILVSDDCEVETILRRGGRSRLVFAAIDRLPVGRTQADEALETKAFRRFGLPPEGGFSGGIVEFQQLFGMAADGVEAQDGTDPRVARLGGEMLLQFEMRWNAYAVRRGPLTHVDNAEKLARLLSADGDAAKLARIKEAADVPKTEELAVAKAVAEALAAAWEIEGALMNRIADLYEHGGDVTEVREALANALIDLGARGQRAAALLRPP